MNCKLYRVRDRWIENDLKFNLLEMRQRNRETEAENEHFEKASSFNEF